MSIAALIAEYDPFHAGHAWQLAELRRRGFDPVSYTHLGENGAKRQKRHTKRACAKMHRPQKAEDEAGKRLLLDNLLGLAGDHQLLIGGDDQHAHIAAPAGDVAHVAVAVLVLVHIDADAQEVQTLSLIHI